ncbi:spore coat protein CotZ [Bacillus sp. FJAT-29790]|uniref:CotY/CotZ family spore coat protein n=1 Tax=Bacillus sp. FJAT-29790 TaxID=1895002 RepID=UPI001C223DBA|nr:CotY/CotZ family spore coat protein [Bacillus sp. FJAT-29790]MBU8877488.1 spore coat protein CotZ [Bacillus sp. FJAT-29790]
MGYREKDNFNGCVFDILRAIKNIQDNEEVYEYPATSFLRQLGAISPSKSKNVTPDSRVFVLKTADGASFHAFFTGNDSACVSIFFRVEEVFNNGCAVLRVLEPINMKQGGETVNIANEYSIDLEKICEVDSFRSTDDFITVELHSFCAVQCIADVDLAIHKD